MSLAHEPSETQGLLSDTSVAASPVKNRTSSDFAFEFDQEDTHSRGLHESTSLNNSPTKPLNFPRFPLKNQQMDSNNSSSSDTYISDDALETNKSSKLPVLNKTTLEFSSLERNFDTDSPEETVSKTPSTKTVEEPLVDEDEFSFTTPRTSTIDLNNPTNTSANSKYINTSPSKSIMKKTPNASPKKSVVFKSTNPEIHHYKEPNSADTTTNQETEPLQNDPQTPKNSSKSKPIIHEWSELSSKSKSPYSDDDGSIPPPPPPHSINSYQNLVAYTKDDKGEGQDVDLSTLTNMKLKHNNYSNLSLNEKLDLFLTNNENNQLPKLNGSKSFADLDTHLSQLIDATKYKTDTNIHYLSLSLQNPKLDEIENPLDSLAQNSEVQLRSSGSSQSSLQSLRDTNRTLESIQDSVGNRGIQLNDGIKGFSDTVAESIIPLTNDKSIAVPPKERPLKISHDEDCEQLKNPTLDRLQGSRNDSEEDEFHDSFDKSYNSTEKSIMNLLNSASTQDLNERVAKKPIQLASPKVKQELTHVFSISNVNDSNPNIKSELNQEFSEVKKESDDGLIKSDSDPADFQVVDTKIQRVHDSGSTNEPVKLVRSVVKRIESRVSSMNSDTSNPPVKVERSNSNNSSVYPQVKSENSMEFPIVKNEPVVGKITGGEEFDNTNDDGNEADESQNSTKMSIRFQLDKDWKLEDSQDGDREDNDDYTSNDLTISSHHANKKMIDFEKFKTESFLNESDSSIVESGARDISNDEPLPDIKLDPKKQETSRVEEPVSKEEIVEREGKNERDAEEEAVEEKESKNEDKEVSNQKDVTDDEVLANSSNIAPSADITLPPIEAETYSSFEEITRDKEDDFEAQFSAEHDADGKPTNFISIWHFQDKGRTHPSKRADEFFKDIKIAKDEKPSGEESQESKSRKSKVLPATVQPKKFKEVNVLSRRVVSPEFEDLNVTDFLPELSEDSGFENHFKFLKHGNSIINYSDAAGNRASFTPLSTKNVLKNIEDPNIVEPPKPSSALMSGIRTTNLQSQQIANVYRSTRPPSLEAQFKVSRPTSFQPQSIRVRSSSKPKGVQEFRRSRFKVPSFEIKYSSVNSPRDLYNSDIFEDTIKEPPTIKSSGMKTLPSMDRDDVKRIMSAKKVITQEDYSNVKLMGQTSKKHSVINLPVQAFDDLQQHASICDASLDTSANREDYESRVMMSHLENELSKKPQALLSQDQFFNDCDIFGESDSIFENNSDAVSGTSSVIHNKPKQVRTFFPDPDPDLINSPTKESTVYKSPQTTLSPEREANIFKTPPKELNEEAGEDEILSDEIKMKYQYLNNISPSKNFTVSTSRSPSPKKSNIIKIGSPMGLVKKGSQIVAVTAGSPKKEPKASFDVPSDTKANNALVNNKLRDLRGQPNDSSSEPKLELYSSAFNDTGVMTPVNPSSEFNFEQNPMANVSQAESAPKAQVPTVTTPLAVTSTPQERGRLFFRVVGLKDLHLPEVSGYNAKFSLTLDNGVHCIKTTNYSINGNHILIGKEFELIVGDSLEFILTLKITYDKPKGGYKEVRERKVVKSKNRFSRMFGSKDIVTVTKMVPVEAKDSWSNKFAQDGSFGRCYVDLEQYEKSITCNTKNFNLTCFNEWETYTERDGTVKKAMPYVIGNLEVKMLFIPKASEQEVLPTSIKSAYESIDELKQELNCTFEGYLYQDGGDCENWKRRFFKLKGTNMIAHSEFSHKTRAKINLAKVVEVIYVDKENINKSSLNYRNFSDVLLLDNAFKIRFANGEIIDFGAKNKSEKLEWISMIEKIVYRNKFRRQEWVKMMLAECTEQPN